MTTPSTTSTARVQAGLLDPKMLLSSLPSALLKLDPRVMAHSPVMFVVEVGAVLSTVLAVGKPTLFAWSVVVWLWLTVIFANLAEAVAEGRGKAQAATLRRAKTDTLARRLRPDGTEETVPAPELRLGDHVVVEAGEIIPGDGDVIEGVASVDESAITGRVSARHPGVRRRPQLGHRWDEGAVRPHRRRHHRQAGRELHRPHDRPGRGSLPPEDTQRDRPEHPAGKPDHRVPDGHRHPAAVRHLLRCRTVARGPGGPAGLSDPDHHRRTSVSHRHRRDGPPGPAQRPGHVGARRGGGRRHQHAAAGQDRNHHPRQPAGRRVPRCRGCRCRCAGRRCAAGQPGRRDSRRALHRGARQDQARPAGTPGRRARYRALRPFHRTDADEWGRPRGKPPDPQGCRRRSDEVGPRQRGPPH